MDGRAVLSQEPVSDVSQEAVAVAKRIDATHARLSYIPKIVKKRLLHIRRMYCQSKEQRRNGMLTEKLKTITTPL